MNSPYERYHRQVILPGIGITGQEKLHHAKVLVIGAGGLGCPVLLYLATAGVGTLGIADSDIVSITNLHRQVLFGDADIGSLKTQSAKARLEALNPEVVVHTYPERVTKTNVLDLIAHYDFIIDCTDNFPARYLLSDTCALSGKPLIFGAIAQFEGQIGVLNYTDEQTVGTNYRDLFPVPPAEGEVRNCSEAGVLNVLAGITGTMMASEVIKLITGIGKPLINKLLSFNLLSNQQHVINIFPHKGGRETMPLTETDLLATDYDLSCEAHVVTSINKIEFLELIRSGDTMITDVRETWELPAVQSYATVNIPLSAIHDHLAEFDKKNIILFCQSGNRSAIAARILTEKLGAGKKIVSLQNGVADLL